MGLLVSGNFGGEFRDKESVSGERSQIEKHEDIADEGDLIETVEIEVSQSIDEGIYDVYKEELDLFMHQVDRETYNDLPRAWREELETWEARISFNNLYINPAHEGYGTPEIEDAVEKDWIEEPEEVQWLANNVTGEWTVNPFAHNDIRFAMQYLNREEMVEELLGGAGEPKYSFIDIYRRWTRFPLPIEQRYGIDPEGDEDAVEWIVEEAMEEIKENVAFGDVRREDEIWEYRPPEGDWHEIKVEINTMERDGREEIAEHIAEVLQGLGFETDVSISMDPPFPPIHPEPYDNLDYHVYIGGWIPSQTEYYQEEKVSVFYAPWYGLMPTDNPQERWNYDEEGYDDTIGPSQRVRNYLEIPDEHMDKTVEDLDNVALELFLGRVETEDEYWDKKLAGEEMGFEESIRVSLVDQYSFYVYDPDSVIGSVPERVNGYDTYFGPRTMVTQDGGLDTATYTGGDRPYMDNWNVYDGSEDIHGEYQRRMVREYGVWNHPQSGIPMPVNNYWMDQETFEQEWPERTYPYEEFEREGPLEGGIEYDFEYDEGELIENITIPDDAVDYFPEDQEWKTVDEYMDEEERYAAVEVTYDVHEEHEWHDGTDFDVRDIMWNYAREKRLGTDTDHDDIYFFPTDDLNTPWWDSIHALEFDRDEGTYTVYGDHTFPAEPKVGQHYSIDPETNQLTYEGWDFLHETDDYDYAGREGQKWIHQLSPGHCMDLVSELEDMLARGYLPEYLDADNMPAHMEDFAMDMTEMESQVNSVIDFIEEYDHAFISMGPFLIEEYDTEDHSMTFEKFENYGYPDRYWAEQFLVEKPVLDSVDAPREVPIGETFDIEGEGRWVKYYPLPKTGSPLTEDQLDDYRFAIYDENERVLTVSSDQIDVILQDNHSEFKASNISADLDEGGAYQLVFEVQEKGAFNYVDVSQTIIIYGDGPPIPILDWEIPEEVTYGEEGNIWVKLENSGVEDATARIHLVDQDTGEEKKIYEEEVPAGEIIEIDYNHTFDELGIFTVELRDGDDRFIGSLGEIFVIEIDHHELTVNIEGEGEVEITPEQEEYENGTEVNLEALADEGWHFVGWTGDYESKEEEITVIMDTDKEITAVFDEEIEYYTLTVNIEGEGEVEITPEQEEYENGTEVDLTAVPEEDWNFVGWTGDHESEEEDMTITMDEDKEITAVFDTELDIYDLTINIDGQGTTDPGEGTHEFDHGEKVTVTAEAEEGWQFDEWTGDHSETEEEITITMDEDKEITAHFVEEPYFEVQITTAEEEFEKGEVVFEYTVKNTGGIEDTRTVEITIGEEVKASEEVTLGADEKYDGEFTWEAEEIGEFEVTISTADHSEGMTVQIVEEIVEEEDDKDIPPETETDYGGLYAAIGFILIGILVMLVLVMKDKKRGGKDLPVLEKKGDESED